MKHDLFESANTLKSVIANASEAIKLPPKLWRGVRDPSFANATFEVHDGFRFLYVAARNVDRVSLTGNSLVLSIIKDHPEWQKRNIPNRARSSFFSTSPNRAESFGELAIGLPFNSVNSFASVSGDFNYIKLGGKEVMELPSPIMQLFYMAHTASRCSLRNYTKHDIDYHLKGNPKNLTKEQVQDLLDSTPFVKFCKSNKLKAAFVKHGISLEDGPNQINAVPLALEPGILSGLHAACLDEENLQNINILQTVMYNFKSNRDRLEQFFGKNPDIIKTLSDDLHPDKLKIKTFDSYAALQASMPKKAVDREVWFEGAHLLFMSQHNKCPKNELEEALKEYLHPSFVIPND